MKAPLAVDSLRRVATLLGVVAVALLQVAMGVASEVPEGWIEYPKPLPESEAMRCANLSRRAWGVALKDGRLDIRKRPESAIAENPHLPFNPIELGLPVRHTSRVLLEVVEDGYLLGIDSGEYGGGLWWINATASAALQLSDDNAVGFVRLGGTLLSLSGWAHGANAEGALLRLCNDAGKWRATLAAKLDGRPEAYFVEDKESALIATGSTLFRFTLPATIEPLQRVNYRLLRPLSIVRLPSGEVFLGLRHFVARLAWKHGSFEETWFVPKDCVVFRGKGAACECLSAE